MTLGFLQSLLVEHNGPSGYIVKKVSIWGLRDFLRLPYLVRKGGVTAWIPPTWQFELLLMCRYGFHRQLFLLVYDQAGRPVARIGVESPRRRSDRPLHFGFFECSREHPGAVVALVEYLARELGGRTVRGPFQFKMEDPFTGLLVKGHELPPTFLMSHAPPYYSEYLEAAGFVGVMDLNSYRADLVDGPWFFPPEDLPDSSPPVRTFDVTRRTEDVRSLITLFNESLGNNWGFEPFEERELQQMSFLSRFFLDPDLVWMVEDRNQLVGAIVGLPNFNEFFLEEGPGLSLRFFRRLLFGPRPQSARGWAMAIKEGYRGGAVGKVLRTAAEAGARERLKWGEISWILDSNRPFNQLWEGTIGQPIKVHRVYERQL